jgi:hypothetical protein
LEVLPQQHHAALPPPVAGSAQPPVAFPVPVAMIDSRLAGSSDYVWVTQSANGSLLIVPPPASLAQQPVRHFRCSAVASCMTVTVVCPCLFVCACVAGAAR